mmetsp:Transcript_70388/g.153442  ORF Transcript_70388/g.153442 Transcript_70388/m.153442 type:complete len:204 (-) Transcript_70388:198-809(-)
MSVPPGAMRMGRDMEDGGQELSLSSSPSAYGSETDPMQVDPANDRYPQCIVWTPIHGCTWCFPFIGHMGIGMSNGEVWEFMGMGATRAPEGGLSFGPVCRYVQLSSRWVQSGMSWDEGVKRGIRKCSDRFHGACVNNCHTFVADCLHEMRYAGVPCWNWLSYLLAVWIFFFGHFVTCFRSTSYLVPCIVVIGGIFFLTSGRGS